MARVADSLRTFLLPSTLRKVHHVRKFTTVFLRENGLDSRNTACARLEAPKHDPCVVSRHWRQQDFGGQDKSFHLQASSKLVDPFDMVGPPSAAPGELGPGLRIEAEPI